MSGTDWSWLVKKRSRWRTRPGWRSGWWQTYGSCRNAHGLVEGDWSAVSDANVNGNRCLSGSERMPRARKIEIAVVNGDVLEFEADVLVLKYAQALYGADRAAWGRLEAVYPDIDLPEVGDHRVVESEPALSAAQVLFIGVEPLHAFGYAEIREFSRRALSILSGHPAGARHIALTIHGPGYGLDEVEAFRSEVAGVIEAMTAQEYPKDLVRITFVERDKRRSKRLSRVLAKVFPDGNIATSGRGSLQTLPEDTQKALRSAGYGSGKANVFVATLRAGWIFWHSHALRAGNG